MRRAVIDVGSNSLLLLVEEASASGWRLIDEQSAVTALGEGTKETGLLSEAAIRRSLATLRAMFDRAKSSGAERTIAAGTMAVRIAKNQTEFLDRASAQDTPVMVLSGEDEARLGFDSVANDPLFHDSHRISIIDPGGQSTELVTAQRRDVGWQTEFRKSFPVGTLGLRGTVLRDESPRPPEILQASAEIDDLIGTSYLRGKAGTAVVLGATGTNLISVRDGLTSWQPERIHGAYLDFEDVSQAVARMMPLTDAQRAAIEGMEPGRERTIHIGALVLERFLNAIGAPGCRVSVRGWRYALLENPSYWQT